MTALGSRRSWPGRCARLLSADGAQAKAVSKAERLVMTAMIMLNLPNCLTLFRILTIPVFLEFLAYHFYWEALVVFAIGGLTDFLDGFVARWMNQQTALGAYLGSGRRQAAGHHFFHHARLDRRHSGLAAVVVVVRDVLIVVGYAIIYFLVEERLQVKPSRIGKWSTTLQLLTLAVALADASRSKAARSASARMFSSR